MALLQLLLILTPTSVSLPSVNLSPPLSAVASSLPLPQSEACICQHHITLHLGVSKHACDMTQRNTPVENILLREHMGRGGGTTGQQKRKQHTWRGVSKRKTEAKKEWRRRWSSRQGKVEMWVFGKEIFQYKWRHTEISILIFKTEIVTAISISPPPMEIPILFLSSWFALHCHGNDVTVSHLIISLLLNTAKKEHGSV